MGVALDSLGNIYFAGYKVGIGEMDTDMVLVKYDENGIEQWNRSWGGNASDHCHGLALDFSDNILLVGSTRSFGAGDEDMVLVKYNENGILQWNATWGGGGFDRCYGGSTDSSENMYLVGVTDSFDLGGGDIALVKYDKNGEQQWNRTWGGIEHDAGRGIATDSLDNIYLVGQTESFGTGGYDMVLVKFSPYIAPTGIPSYNIFIIIGILSISSLFLIKKIKFRKSN